MRKITISKKVTVKVPKAHGAPKHKAKSSAPHFRMRHLSPMGHTAFGTPPGQSGGPAFPPAGPPDGSAPAMAFGGGGGAAPPGDMGPGGAPPPVPGM